MEQTIKRRSFAVYDLWRNLARKTDQERTSALELMDVDYVPPKKKGRASSED